MRDENSMKLAEKISACCQGERIGTCLQAITDVLYTIATADPLGAASVIEHIDRLKAVIESEKHEG